MLFRLIALAAVALSLIGAPVRASQSTLTVPGPPLPMTSLATFLNSAFDAVGSNFSGTTAPTSPILFQWWMDSSTSPRTMKIWDGASWVAMGFLNTSTHTWTPVLPVPLPVTTGGTGATSFTANLPLIGAGTGAIASGTVSGNTTKFATVGNTTVTAALECANWDANGNVQRSGAACGSGTGSSESKLYTAAGGDYTPGTTTALVLPFTPSAATSVQIFFDGVNIATDQWSLSVATITFTSPIPTFTKKVQVSYIATATFAGVVSYNGETGNVTAPTSSNNLLINSGFELAAGLGLATKFNDSGSGTLGTFNVTSTSVDSAVFQASFSGTTMSVSSMTSGTIGLGSTVSASGVTTTTVSALGSGLGGVGTYTLATSQPALGTRTALSTNGTNVVTINITPSSSNQIKKNFLVQLSAACDASIRPLQAGSNPIYTALRVISTTGSPVSSFTVKIPRWNPGAAFSTAGCTGTVVTPSELLGNSGNGPSTWKKTAAASGGMLTWMENDPNNFDPIGGSTQVVGIRQGTDPEQYMYQTFTDQQVINLQGQKMTCGSRIKPTGAGVARTVVFVNGTAYYGTASSTSLTYGWSPVTVDVPAGSTSIIAGIATQTPNTSFFWSKPICVPGPGMPTNFYYQRPAEVAHSPGIFNVWSYYGLTLTTPSVQLTGSPFFGFEVDLYGETAGQIHPLVGGAIGDMEAASSSLPATMITATQPSTVGLPGGSILWVQSGASYQNAVGYHQPLLDGRMIFAAGQANHVFNQVNLDLFSVYINWSPLQ